MEIINYPNYLIYRDGRVFSKKSNKFLKESTNKDGYKQLSLWKDRKEKKFKIHRLIGIHYIRNPENKETIDHINRNRSDNRVENLQWATRKEQSENQGKYKNNTSGHKGINYCKTHKIWKYRKRGKYKVCRSFKCKIDAICFKFYWILKNNSRKYYLDLRDTLED